MTDLLTAAQMRAIEAAAIASGTVTGLDLMERAGRGVVEAVFAEWPELAAGSFRAVVLCGPGNNGGDGFVVARLLKEWGWSVEVYLYGTPEGMPGDARANYERWVAMGAVMPFADMDTRVFHGTPLVVDALFGTGLSRTTNMIGGLWDMTKGSGCRLIAVDIVSGLCADSGRYILNDASEDGAHYFVPPFDLTVTFHSAKPGHYLADGSNICGRVKVVDIDLPHRAEGVLMTATPRNLTKPAGHKYSHGHALILSGPPGHGGAARMSARGAQRIGAGLVTLACPPDALAENAGRLEAIMLTTVADAAKLRAILTDARITALCLGPGFGTGPAQAAMIATALHAKRPMVLDADALTLLSRDPTLFAALHSKCVLTPHGGEFARLFPDIAAKLDAPATKGPAYSKVDATREAAARVGCVVLFKGPDTVIASPDGSCAINSAAYDRAAPWLATAGSGDVLAGFITGLLARGFAPQQAAETGAWLHVECARSFGPGLIAEDLPEELPKVFRALGL